MIDRYTDSQRYRYMLYSDIEIDRNLKQNLFALWKISVSP